MNIDLSDFHSGKSKVTHIRTSGSMSDGEQWNVVSSNVICENSKLNIELLPNSISTYIFTLK
jgi:hypothetical protein